MNRGDMGDDVVAIKLMGGDLENPIITHVQDKNITFRGERVGNHWVFIVCVPNCEVAWPLQVGVVFIHSWELSVFLFGRHVILVMDLPAKLLLCILLLLKVRDSHYISYLIYLLSNFNAFYI